MDRYENIRQLSPVHKQLYKAIRELEPVTKTELVERLNYSRTTLNRFLTPLLDGGFVIEDGLDESNGGRKSFLYRSNPKSYYVAGVLISRYATRFVIHDLSFDEPLYRDTVYMTGAITPKKMCDRLGEMFDDALATLRLSRKDFFGVGATIAYRYDHDTGKTRMDSAKESAAWEELPIRDMLQATFDLPLWTDDIISAALRYRYAEYQRKGGKGYRRIGVIGCGIITHAGVIFDGKIIRGLSEGFAHMTINEGGELCRCGKRGCIAAYTYADKLVQNYKFVSGCDEDISINKICKLANEGDVNAVNVIQDAARQLAVGIKNLVRMFSLELVSINGLMVYDCPMFFETCKEEILREKSLTLKEIIYNKDGEYSGASTAANLAFYNFIR